MPGLEEYIIGLLEQEIECRKDDDDMGEEFWRSISYLHKEKPLRDLELCSYKVRDKVLELFNNTEACGEFLTDCIRGEIYKIFGMESEFKPIREWMMEEFYGIFEDELGTEDEIEDPQESEKSTEEEEEEEED